MKACKVDIRRSVAAVLAIGIATSSVALAQDAELVASPAIKQVRVAPSTRPIEGVLPFDRVTRGTLTQSEPAHIWRLRLQKGAEAQIDLASEDFDTYLEVYRAGETVPLSTNNDNGEGRSTNSRLRFQAPLAGDYFISVSSKGDVRVGSYELLARPREQAVAPCNIGFGTPITTSLVDVDNSKNYARSCFFNGRQGQRVSIAMNAVGFDPVVELRLGGSVLATDDDSGGNYNALLTKVLPSDGLYEILGRTVLLESEKQAGFTLALSELPAPKTVAEIGDVTVAQPQDGSFTDDNVVDEFGTPYALYHLIGHKGERFKVTAEWPGNSKEPQTGNLRVQVGVESLLGFASARTAISVGTRPPSVIIRFVEDGTALVRISSPAARIRRFHLTVVPAPEDQK